MIQGSDLELFWGDLSQSENFSEIKPPFEDVKLSTKLYIDLIFFYLSSILILKYLKFQRK